MYIFFIIILYLLYIEINFGIRNYLFNFPINCYFILDGNFNKAQFIETLNSYNFDVIDKIDNNIIVNYKSNKEILKFKIDNHIKYYRVNIIFDHKFFDMQSIINIINNYLKNNIKKKNIITYKNFYLNDLLAFNIFYSSLLNNNKTPKYKKIIIKNDYVEKIKKKINKYVSKIDIIISIISKIYLNTYNKKVCNIILTKADKSKQNDYFGNPVTNHLTQINQTNLIDIAIQIRESYKNNKIYLFENIDIYITSWFPIENYENKIKELSYNVPPRINVNFSIILCMINNDYVINIYYY
jgi:hypothetical protein